MKKRVELMLDSGAFSAWTSGLVIDVHDYIEFVQQNEHLIEIAVNLDVIPGTIGGSPTSREIEDACKAGWKNLIAMRDAGCNVMPVYHFGERTYWLDKMLGEGFKWVGLGGLVGRATKQRHQWLDKVFARLCRGGGYPGVRIHGFGATGTPTIMRYPWFSVDSTAWLQAAGKNGGIMVPRRAPGGGYDYSRRPSVIAIGKTGEGKGASQLGKQHAYHYDTMGAAERAYVLKYVKHFGFKIRDLRNHYEYRAMLAVKLFEEFLQDNPVRPFRSPDTSLFVKGGKRYGSSKPVAKHVRVYYAAAESSFYSLALNTVGAWRRLLSYKFLAERMDRRKGFLKHYIKTGLTKPDARMRGSLATRERKALR